MDGVAELYGRVARLDAGSGDPPMTASNPDVERFISVLERVTSTSLIDETGGPPYASAADADAVMATCRLLARLDAAAPQLTIGPLRADTQYWIATGRPDHLPRRDPTPNSSTFIDAGQAATTLPSTKPFWTGLFTCTGVFGTYGMWQTYLEFQGASTLFPRPWRAWRVTPNRNVAIREISSAVQWVDFVRRYPTPGGELIFPDWRSVAEDYDAVHMTLRAISATQGLCFPTQNGIVAAPYWDLESTLWLRWCFSAVNSSALATRRSERPSR